MKVVTLKNGTEEAEPLVASTMLILNGLIDKSPLVFYDLVMLCRNKDYKCFGNAEYELIDMALLQPDGRPHQSISNIVKSAVVGDSLDISLVNPLKLES